MKSFIKLVFIIFIFLGCGSDKKKPEDTKKNTDIQQDQNKSVAQDQNKSMEQDQNKSIAQVQPKEHNTTGYKYGLDENGNITDEDGSVIDGNAVLDNNGYIIDKSGNIIDKDGNLLDTNGSIIGVYIPTNQLPLLLAISQSGFNVEEHGYRVINIDGVDYRIKSTLHVDSPRKIGISDRGSPNFFGSDEKKGFVFSKNKYVAIVKEDEDPSIFFQKFGNLLQTNVIMSVSYSNFRFESENVIYKSPPRRKECLSDIENTLIVPLYVKTIPVGSFHLKCNTTTGELTSIGVTNFTQVYDTILHVGLGDINTAHQLEFTNPCTEEVLDPDVPPLPNQCFLDKLK